MIRADRGPTDTVSSTRRIRVGFLGAGGWGRECHLPALRLVAERMRETTSVEIGALCERDPAVASEVSAEYGIPRVYGTVEELAAAPDVDCFVVIVRPSSLRALLPVLASRGLPIFTEKPPGLTHDDALWLARTITVPNVVGFNRRYFPLNRRYREILGEMQGTYFAGGTMLRSERYDSHRGAGHEPFVTGTGVHLINLMEYFFGRIVSGRTEVLEVSSNATRAWSCEVRFDTGIRGRMLFLPCSGSHAEWVEAHSRRQSAFLRGCQYGVLEPPGRIEIHREGKSLEIIQGDAGLPHLVAAGFVGEYEAFFRTVTEGRPGDSTLETSENTMRVAEAIEAGRSF